MSTKEKIYNPIDTTNKVIAIDVKCIEFKGGLLDATNGPPYTLYHADGTSLTQCHPVTNGVTKTSWDPAWNVSKFKNKPPSMFSGLMRQVVQCLYSRNSECPYSPSFYKTHGIFKGAVSGDTRPYWVVEISNQGVYAKRLPFLDLREDKDEHDFDAFIAKKCYDADDIEFSGTTSTYELSKKCCSVGNVRIVNTSSDDTVVLWPEWSTQQAKLAANPLTVIHPLDRIHKLLVSSDVAEIYNDYFPFYTNAGWAFNYTGSEAQCVVWKLYDESDTNLGHVTARWKISISEGTQSVAYKTSTGSISLRSEATLTGSIASVEEARFYPPLSKNLLWYPDGGSFRQFHTPLSGTPPDIQDAPVHVWYVNNTENVVRYSRSVTTIPAGTYESYNGEPLTCNLSTPRTGGKDSYTRVYGTQNVLSGFTLGNKNTQEEKESDSIISHGVYNYPSDIISDCGQDSLGDNKNSYQKGELTSLAPYNVTQQYVDACILLENERESVICVEHKHEKRAFTDNGAWAWGYFLWKLEVWSSIDGTCSGDVTSSISYCHGFGSDNFWPSKPQGNEILYVNGTAAYVGVLNNVFIISGNNENSFVHDPGTLCANEWEICPGTRDGDFWYKFLIHTEDETVYVSADTKHAKTGKYLYLKQHDNQPYHDEEYVIEGGFNTTYGDLFIGKI